VTEEIHKHVCPYTAYSFQNVCENDDRAISIVDEAGYAVTYRLWLRDRSDEGQDQLSRVTDSIISHV